MKTSVHGLQKKLRREQRHEIWLRKNLKSSKAALGMSQEHFEAQYENSCRSSKVISPVKLNTQKDVIEFTIYNIFAFSQ